MKSLLSYSLVVVGLLCVGKALFIVAEAEAHQSGVLRAFSEPDSGRAGEPKLPPGAIARMRFPRLYREVNLWADADPDNLKKGPVWLHLTESFASTGNTVVAGHRDTHFRFLKDAKVGDIFEVEQDTLHYTFRISSIRIVGPTDRALLAPTETKTVTLVTCYPFHVVGRANRRMIVRAELVPTPPVPTRIN